MLCPTTLFLKRPFFLFISYLIFINKHFYIIIYQFKQFLPKFITSLYLNTMYPLVNIFAHRSSTLIVNTPETCKDFLYRSCLVIQNSKIVSRENIQFCCFFSDRPLVSLPCKCLIKFISISIKRLCQTVTNIQSKKTWQSF